MTDQANADETRDELPQERGPSALGGSLGQLGNPGHPDVQTVPRQAAGHQHPGKNPGCQDRGCAVLSRLGLWRYVAGSSDLGLLISSTRDLLARMSDGK